MKKIVLMLALILGITSYVEAGKVFYRGLYLMVTGANRIGLTHSREKATDFKVGYVDDFTDYHGGLYYLDDPSKRVLFIESAFSKRFLCLYSNGTIGVSTDKEVLSFDHITWRENGRSPNYLLLAFGSVDSLCVEYSISDECGVGGFYDDKYACMRELR